MKHTIRNVALCVGIVLAFLAYMAGGVKADNPPTVTVTPVSYGSNIYTVSADAGTVTAVAS